jgi:hypothetical protein
MAFKLTNFTDGTLDVVSSNDPALDMTADEYDTYQSSLDPSLLKLKEGQEPTIFVLKKVLPYGVSQRIKGKQMTYDKGEVYVGTGHISDEVRAALSDIKNPASCDDPIKFKKSGDGGATPEIMAMLDAFGITQDLYIARKLYLERAASGGGDALKKNS